MNIKIFNKYLKNYEFINSIEGSINSNYFYILISVKKKKWGNMFSKQYFKSELIFFQIFSIGSLSIVNNFLALIFLFTKFN
jgi:hypothetical protein